MSTLFTNGNTTSQIASTSSTANNPLDASDISRVLPRQLSTGSTRGTQTVGYGDTKIDGSNNTITVGSSIFLDGNNSVITVSNTASGENGLGELPDNSNDSGFFQTDSTGTIIYKLVNGSTYIYNSSDGYVNTILIGFAPDDGRPGIWVAKPTFDATELLS